MHCASTVRFTHDGVGIILVDSRSLGCFAELRVCALDLDISANERYVDGVNDYNKARFLFRVDGQEVGDTLTLPGNGGTVEIEAWAESTLPIHTLQIIQQGRVVAQTEQVGGVRRLELRQKLRIDHHTWLAARCGGPGYATAIPHLDLWQRGIMAHTSPVYIAVGEPWQMFDAGTASYMLTLLDGSLSYIRQRSPQYPPGAVTHPHGDDDHLTFLEAPFQEAIQAIHRRMHERGIAH